MTSHTALAEFVRILGRGPGRSRSLTQDEASAAMQIMLTGQAAPQAVGAILMLMRMKGEVAAEIAGFAAAARDFLNASTDMTNVRVDLDWPCYAAGRTRGLPWFLLSAKLVACTGTRVLLHGWNGKDPAIRTGLDHLCIPVVQDFASVNAALDRHNIAYLPLENAYLTLFNLLNLRDILGLRSCINTVCRMLNPAGAPDSVQGVFHPPYRLLQADAAALLGWRNLTVIKGGGGEFERHPGKVIDAFGLRAGAVWQEDIPAISDDKRKLSDLELPYEALTDLWQNGVDVSDGFATDLVLGTADLALETIGHGHGAAELWQARHGAAASSPASA